MDNKIKDKTDGGKCTVDCKISARGGDHAGGCADCTHKDDFINKIRKLNTKNTKTPSHKTLSDRNKSIMKSWGYKTIPLA